MNMKSYPYLLWFALEFAGIMLIASGFGFELGQFGNQICLAIGALAYAVGATSKDFVLKERIIIETCEIAQNIIDNTKERTGEKEG